MGPLGGNAGGGVGAPCLFSQGLSRTLAPASTHSAGMRKCHTHERLLILQALINIISLPWEITQSKPAGGKRTQGPWAWVQVLGLSPAPPELMLGLG